MINPSSSSSSTNPNDTSPSFPELTAIKKDLLSIIQSNTYTTNSNMFSTIESTLFTLLYTTSPKQINDITSLRKHINDIIKLLYKLISTKTKTQPTECDELFTLFEKLFYLFLFHYDFEIVHYSYLILKCLIELTDTSYHIDLLINIIRLIQILTIKKQQQHSTKHNIIIHTITSNCSSALVLIIHLSNSIDVQKAFYDFIKRNISEYALVYLLIISYDSEFNLTKVLSPEQIQELLELCKNEFDKVFKYLDAFVNGKAYDHTVSANEQVCQLVDKVGVVCKIMDVFILRGYRTYSVDKIIKNMVPNARKLIMLLMNKINFDNNGSSSNSKEMLSEESIINIITLCKTIQAFDSDNALQFMKWLFMLSGDCTYVYVIAVLVSNVLVQCVMNDQNYAPNRMQVNNVIGCVMQHVDAMLRGNEMVLELNEDIVVKFAVVMIVNAVKLIDEKWNVDGNLYPSVAKYMKKCLKEMEENGKENSEYYYRIYNDALMNGNNNGSNGGKCKYESNNMLECVNKFEEFKNAIKKCCNMGDTTLNVDKQIQKFKHEILANDNNTNNNASKASSISDNEIDFEVFFLDTSLKLYSELFN